MPMADSDDDFTQHRLTALHANGTWDEVACLSNSLQRVRILIALTTTHADLRDLRDRLDIPRTTLQRNLAVLEQQGWIDKEPSGYSVTGTGRLLVHEFLTMIETVEIIETLAPVLNAVASPTAIDITQFEAPTVTVPTPAQPYAPIIRLREVFSWTDGLRGILPVASWLLADVARYPAEDDPADHEYIVSSAALDMLRTQSLADHGRLTNTNRSARITLHAYKNTLPYGLVLSQDRLALAAYDEQGRIDALVESQRPTTITWGEHIYEHYRQQSTRLADTDVSHLIRCGETESEGP